MLLDRGSTPNFVQTCVATFLHLPIEKTPLFSVLVRNGDRLHCMGIFRQVLLVIQGQEINVDFYVLPLKGWDMVLGIEWLVTLGPVVTNYVIAQFQFTYNNQPICWQGDTSQIVHQIKYNCLR